MTGKFAALEALRTQRHMHRHRLLAAATYYMKP